MTVRKRTPKKTVRMTSKKTTAKKAAAKRPVKKRQTKKKVTAKKKITAKVAANTSHDELLVSVYTPTDDDKFLEDCYNSLKSQDYPHWEWIIIPNGESIHSKFLAHLKDTDDRVIVRDFPLDGSSIGALKKFAVHSCSGQLYVELDHDDMLTPGALSEIVRAYKETSAGFLYSNFVSFREDGSSITYPDDLGWENYPFKFEGKEYKASRAFEAKPDALHRLIYAPNHVRVWSSNAYKKAGGYDSSYEVCDDFDLITRTYLSGVKFHHIDKCLYMYRQWSGSRSVESRNAEIQKVEGELAHLRSHNIVNEYCNRQGIQVVDVSLTGSGNSVGFADIASLEDNSVGWFRVANIFQYIPGVHVVDWINDAWRKLVPGGWLSISVPSTESQGAFQNPTYKSYWNVNSFQYFVNPDQAAPLMGNNKYVAHYHIARQWSALAAPTGEEPVFCANADLIAIKDDSRIAGTTPH